MWIFKTQIVMFNCSLTMQTLWPTITTIEKFKRMLCSYQIYLKTVRWTVIQICTIVTYIWKSCIYFSDLLFMIFVNMLPQAVSVPEMRTSISRVLSTLVHPQTVFSPATLSYDMYSYALLMHLLTWMFCRICCKNGWCRLYGLLQCDLAYCWTPLAFHICCR